MTKRLTIEQAFNACHRSLSKPTDGAIEAFLGSAASAKARGIWKQQGLEFFAGGFCEDCERWDPAHFREIISQVPRGARAPTEVDQDGTTSEAPGPGDSK